MDEQTLRLLQRLRLSNLALTANIRARLDAELTARWRALGSWRDDDIQRLLNDILPVVTAAETRMVDVTNASLASASAAAGGTAFRPSAPRYQELTGSALRGLDPDVVFRRPQMVLNSTLAAGKSLTAAVTAGEKRLLSLGATNLQLAKTKTVAAVGRAPFYRRVLTGAENCALCVIASTQRYRTGILAPIHPGCDCGIEEIFDALAPHVIEPKLLELTHEEITRKLGFTDRSAFDLGLDLNSEYSDFTALTIVREHGELGPVLAWRGENFRGPTKVGKDRAPQRSAKDAETARWSALQRTSEKSIRILEQAKRDGTNMVDLVQNQWSQPQRVKDLDAAIAYHRSVVDRASSALAELRTP